MHRLVPVMKYIVYDDVKDCRGDDVSLGDATFCWERCSKEAVLPWDYGVGVPEVVEDMY